MTDYPAISGPKTVTGNRCLALPGRRHHAARDDVHMLGIDRILE
jgi:hypothetical protein